MMNRDRVIWGRVEYRVDYRVEYQILGEFLSITVKILLESENKYLYKWVIVE